MSAPTPAACPAPGAAPGPGQSRRRRWYPALIGAGCAVAAAVAIGVPTGVVPSPWFLRMSAVPWWAYPVWACAALLIGVIAARRVRWRTPPRSGAQLFGGVGTAVAVGCPACNQVIALTVGPAATGLWALVQPVVGLVSILGLVWVAARQRSRTASASQPATGPRLPVQLSATMGGPMCLTLPSRELAGTSPGPQPPARSSAPGYPSSL